MKTLYLDIFSGISGDMFIGAMFDLGLDAHGFEHELKKLKLDEFHLQVSRGERGAIAGTKFDVHLAHEHGHVHSHSHQHGPGGEPHSHEHVHEHGSEHHDHLVGESHGPHGGPLVAHEPNFPGAQSGRIEISVFETNVPPRFRLYFYDADGHGTKPMRDKNVTLETIRDGQRRQYFEFSRCGEYLEAIDELPEPHEFKAVLGIKRGARTEKLEIQFVEDHHHAGSETGAPHEHHHEHGRNFADIAKLIQHSKLSPWVKEKSVAVFHRVAVAEGKIHGHPPEQVHFHEVGAVDSIVDIVGACVALEMLGKPRVLAANPIEGTGTIHCAHGTFPIPAPATLEILSARSATLQQCEEPGELITPTGAAILAEFVEAFGPMPHLAVEKIGYGLGTRHNKTRPNVLRAIFGEGAKAQGPKSKADGNKELDWETDTVAVLETNLDDINSELLGALVEKALAAGALDVFYAPVTMKKSRPGVLLTLLCAEADADEFSELILRETTAFGVRRTVATRRKLRREAKTVKTKFGHVAVKFGLLNGRVIQASPEFESCRTVAGRAGVTVREVYDAARKAVNV